MALRIVMHIGLGRAASSTIQWFLSESFGSQGRFFGDTKTGVGLSAHNIKNYNNLIVSKNIIERPCVYQSIGNQLIEELKLSGKCEEDKNPFIYYSEERLSDSFTYDLSASYQNLANLFTYIGDRLNSKVEISIVLVIRDEYELLKSYIENNINSNDIELTKKFLDEVSGATSDDIAYVKWDYLQNLLQQNFPFSDIHIFNFQEIKNEQGTFLRKFVFDQDDLNAINWDKYSVSPDERIRNSKYNLVNYNLKEVLSLIFHSFKNVINMIFLKKNNRLSNQLKLYFLSKSLRKSNSDIWQKVSD